MKITIVTILFFILSACSALPETTPTPTPSPMPACGGGACVRNVYLDIGDDGILLIEFDLVDYNYEVNFGEEPYFQSEITFALFLRNESGEDFFLSAFSPPANAFDCYSGNDIPWTEGNLGAVCSIAFPSSGLQVQIDEGDLVRVEIIEPKFDRDVIWLE